MTDTTRDLIQRMARELDLYRQMARDDCTSTHPFADEARAYLAQSELEGPTDRELVAVLKQAIKDFPPNHPDAKALDSLEYDIEIELRKARAVLARWGRPAVEQVSVIERLPGDNIRSINYPDPSPERKPTNPFTGRPVEGSTDKGKNPTTKPVSVIERLPGPEDCDENV